jgi:hypothetical protein
MGDLTPRARRDGIVVEEVEGELLLYDQRTDEAHRLNGTAAALWRVLDGTQTVPELVEVLNAQVGDVADEDLVMVTLDELGEANLLEDHAEREAEQRRVSRRRFIRRVGVVGTAALALPVVRSIVAPTPASAQGSCGICYCYCTCYCVCYCC